MWLKRGCYEYQDTHFQFYGSEKILRAEEKRSNIIMEVAPITLIDYL